jgi:uncharacterized heparinase superfamily protein
VVVEIKVDLLLLAQTYHRKREESRDAPSIERATSDPEAARSLRRGHRNLTVFSGALYIRPTSSGSWHKTYNGLCINGEAFQL